MNGTVMERPAVEPQPIPEHDLYSVLIVDDDRNFRRGIQRLFYLLGKEVVFRGYEASGGEEALALLNRHPVDCVMLDYRMEGGDGLEWLARIIESRGDLPVIMVTGAGGEEVAVAALKNGAADYLVKGSITPDALRRSLIHAIEKARMRVTLERQRQELIEAEKQKAMIQSLGAACHHLGQPATALQCCFTLLQRLPLAPEVKALVEQSCGFADQMNAILHDLQRVCAFTPVSYRRRADGDPERCDESILKIA